MDQLVPDVLFIYWDLRNSLSKTLFGVTLNHFFQYSYATMVYPSPVTLVPPAVVALMGILIGGLASKSTWTGATVSVAGCIVPEGGVLVSLVVVLRIYSSDSDGTAWGAITAVSGEYIKSIFGGSNKAPPGDYSAMIFYSVASVIYALVKFCWVMDGSVGANYTFGLSCKGERPFLTNFLFIYYVLCVPKMIKVETMKLLGLVLAGITRS